VRALSSHVVRVRGLRVHARVGGLDRDGPPLVLVHGLGVSSTYLEPLARELAATACVLAPDLPGYGRSERPPSVPGVAELATALSDWLEAIGVARAVVLGNSLGCQIAVELAVREPDRVEALVLVAPTVDPHARGWARQGWRLLVDCSREPLPLLAVIAREYATFGPRRLAATARSALGDAIEEKLPRSAPRRWSSAASGTRSSRSGGPRRRRRSCPAAGSPSSPGSRTRVTTRRRAPSRSSCASCSSS